MIFDKLLWLNHVVFVEEGQITDHELTSMEAHNYVLCPQGVYVEAGHCVLVKLASIVVKSTVESVSLAIVGPEGPRTRTNDDDFVTNSDASGPFILQLSSQIGLVHTKVHGLNLGKDSLLN